MSTNLKSVAFIINTILVSILASASFFGCNKKESIASVENSVYENITPKKAKDMIRANSGNESFIILDIRTPEEYETGYIEGAVNTDYYSDTFRKNLSKMQKNRTYLVYCRSGNRSGKTFEIMKELGFEQVYNMTGGMNDWMAEGFPVIK